MYLSKVILLLIFSLFSNISFAGEPWYREVIDLKGYWKFSIGDRIEWSKSTFQDRYWEELRVPSSWEDQGFHGYDGYAWYRTTFNGADLPEKIDYYLQLGYVDDVDEVYINGELIGFSGGFPPYYKTAYYAKRMYAIPKHLLNFEGENVIAVRVYDQEHSGGIQSGRIGIYKLHKEIPEKITLEGMWKIRHSFKEAWISAETDVANWGEVMLPSYWKKNDSFHNRNSSMTCWRQIHINKIDPTVNYMLVMGKIDDYDETYLNNKKVGSTNDQLPLGRSNSWQQLRIYTIPKGLLKEGKNTIAVHVIDLGVDAGIYQGPLMLIPERYLTRYLRDNYGSF